MKTILAPIDFSPVSQPVVAEAVALARTLGARLVLLHVVRPVPLLPSTFGVESFGGELPAGTVAEAHEKLHQLQRDLLRDSVTAHTLYAVGEPPAEIVRQADRLVSDFIVMGSHGHGALYDLLLGSTTQQVLKGASCPVVVIPPRAELLAATRRPEIAGLGTGR